MVDAVSLQYVFDWLPGRKKQVDDGDRFFPQALGKVVTADSATTNNTPCQDVARIVDNASKSWGLIGGCFGRAFLVPSPTKDLSSLAKKHEHGTITCNGF